MIPRTPDGLFNGSEIREVRFASRDRKDWPVFTRPKAEERHGDRADSWVLQGDALD